MIALRVVLLRKICLGINEMYLLRSCGRKDVKIDFIS